MMNTQPTSGPLRRTITPDTAMQKAVELVMAPFPSDTEIHQAQALVSMARELRIAAKHRSRAYGSVEYEVTPEPPEEPQVDEPVGVDVDGAGVASSVPSDPGVTTRY